MPARYPRSLRENSFGEYFAWSSAMSSSSRSEPGSRAARNWPSSASDASGLTERKATASPRGIIQIAQHAVALAALILVMADQIAHQPDESEVDRMGEGVLDGRSLVVLGALEIVEDMGTAAGEEGL